MSDTTTTPAPNTDAPPATDDAEAKPTQADKDWQAEADKWKRLSRENESKAKANADAAKRLAEIENANATELEKAVAKARQEGEAAATERVNALLIGAEARALAAALKFQDPSDAVRFLDLSDVEVKDGEVNSDDVKALLTALAKDKPYLLTNDKTPPTGEQVGLGVVGNPTSTDPRQAARQQMEADIRAGRRRT